MQNLLKISLVLLVLSLTACGIQFYPAKTKLPFGANSIFIQPFENNTFVPSLANLSRDALLQQISFKPEIQIIYDNTADLIVVGGLNQYKQSSSSLISNNTTFYIYTFTATVSLQLISPKNQKIERWSVTAEHQLQSQDAMLNEADEQKAIHELAKKMGKNLFERLAVDF